MNERIFTGCYDANGTPIYTGDILKWFTEEKDMLLDVVRKKEDGEFYCGEALLVEMLDVVTFYGSIFERRTESD